MNASSVFFFQRPDSVDDDLPIFVQPNLVLLSTNSLSIYVVLVRLVSFDYQRPYSLC